MEWFTIQDIDRNDTPALAVYPTRVQHNIDLAIQLAGGASRLRPHVKTSKMAEVCRMMMRSGIQKFKCATLAEAAMLGEIGAPDVLFAYPPVGPKAHRILELSARFPATIFSCLLDHPDVAEHLSAIYAAAGRKVSVYIDVNNGMNRTGVAPAKAAALMDAIQALDALELVGLQIYDGHISNADEQERERQADRAFDTTKSIRQYFQEKTGREPLIIAGGSATFSAHRKRPVEYSPGTFVLWDAGYSRKIPELPFQVAALVVTRVISITSDTHLTTDLGHKSVAAENPLATRVYFLNAPGSEAVGQSEEHLVLKVPDTSGYQIGQVLYGVPEHICPTVALYEQAMVIPDHQIAGYWTITREKRY